MKYTDKDWRQAIKSYGIEVNNESPEEVVRKIFYRLQQKDHSWRKEIEKYLPQIGVMSFIGPEPTIKWLMERVTIKKSDKIVADQLKQANKEENHEKRTEKRLRVLFPRLFKK